MKKPLVIAILCIVVLSYMYLNEVFNRENLIVNSVVNIKAKCNDGMYTTSDRNKGSCSKHGGVDYWIK